MLLTKKLPRYRINNSNNHKLKTRSYHTVLQHGAFEPEKEIVRLDQQASTVLLKLNVLYKQNINIANRQTIGKEWINARKH